MIEESNSQAVAYLFISVRNVQILLGTFGVLAEIAAQRFVFKLCLKTALLQK